MSPVGIFAVEEGERTVVQSAENRAGCRLLANPVKRSPCKLCRLSKNLPEIRQDPDAHR
ncbi:MAG: hypothetical protein HPM95_06825 [Alphaproteobacteria bacterium]|nr:hypothetical protein [Alphaproteobacteria bacterium]